MTSALPIHCFAPRLLGPVPATLAKASETAGPFPNLTELVFRAQRKALPGNSLEALIAQQYPDAPAPGPLIAASDGQARVGICYRAAPVHLRADRDRLLLFAGEGLCLTTAQSEQIKTAFNSLFSADGLVLEFINGEGLLTAKRRPGPDLPALSEVAGEYLDIALPTEPASRAWRQLLNEVQMLLHEHPVNRERTAAGELVVNGLWFWGGGEAPRGDQLSLPDDPEAAPLVSSLPASASVRVFDQAEKALLGGDVGAWLAALESFETHQAAELLNAIRHEQRSVLLMPGNGWAYRTGPMTRWRFWLRRKPLSAAIALQ